MKSHFESFLNQKLQTKENLKNAAYIEASNQLNLPKHVYDHHLLTATYEKRYLFILRGTEVFTL